MSETPESKDKAQQALELAQANAKAIQELKEELKKSVNAYHSMLLRLKERNRLR